MEASLALTVSRSWAPIGLFLSDHTAAMLNRLDLRARQTERAALPTTIGDALAKRPAHRPCLVCNHPDRVLIERAKICGAGDIDLAARFAVSHDAIYRHMRNHVTAETRQAYISEGGLRQLAKQAAADGMSTLDRYRVAIGDLQNQARQAAQDGDRTGLANISRALFQGLGDLGKLTGEALEHVGKISLTQINFHQSPDYLALEAMLIERLAPFPDALRSVLDGLSGLEETRTSDVPKLIEGTVIDDA
jgi:hypothetical protein